MGVEASSKVHSQPPQGSYTFYSPQKLYDDENRNTVPWYGPSRH